MAFRTESELILESNTSSSDDESEEQKSEKLLKKQNMDSAINELKELQNQLIFKNCFNKLDLCLTLLTQHRQSDYYKTLEKNRMNNTPLIAGEWLYLALTTDDILKINHLELMRILKQDVFYYEISPSIRKNITIMIHAIALSKEVDDNKKTELTTSLLKELQDRKKTAYKKIAFLNLSGVYLKGINLAHASFEFSNLENANFEHTVLEGVHFSYSNLNKINLANAFSNHEKKYYCQGKAGIVIMYCVAKEANFNNFYLGNGDVSHTQFDHSTFQSAILEYTCFSGTSFNFCNLENAVFKDSHLNTQHHPSLKSAYVNGANLASFNLQYGELDNMIFFSPEHIQNDPDYFKKALSHWHIQLLEIIKDYKYFHALITKKVLIAIAHHIQNDIVENTNINFETRLSCIDDTLNQFFPIKNNKSILSDLFPTKNQSSDAFDAPEAKLILEKTKEKMALKITNIKP